VRTVFLLNGLDQGVVLGPEFIDVRHLRAHDVLKLGDLNEWISDHVAHNIIDIARC
jgi:hypothetical protein